MKGFDSHPVPVEEEFSIPLVPQSDGKHAAKPLDEIFTLFFVKVNDDLRVRSCFEAMSFLEQLVPEFLKVIDLAIEDGPNILFLIRKGLMTAFKIDDTQASHAKAHVLMEPIAFVVRPAMQKRVIHPAKDSRIDGSFYLGMDNSDDSTHVFCISLGPKSFKPFSRRSER
jgi:hypothetical protein